MAFREALSNQLATLVVREGNFDAFYAATYPLIREYFRENISTGELTEQAAQTAALLVYTWMRPATLPVQALSKFSVAKEAIVNARSGAINLKDLKSIIAFVDGSVIATSKYLHFIRPDRFAIWDRRVAKAAYDLKHHYQINDANRYLDYLSDLVEFQLPVSLALKLEELLPDQPELRRKEFALFHCGLQMTT